VARGPEQDRVLAHLQKHQGLYDESGKLIKRLKRGQPVIVRKSWMKYEQMALMQRTGCVHFKLQGRDMAADLFKDALHTFVIPYDD
jgi:hypothetical protein